MELELALWITAATKERGYVRQVFYNVICLLGDQICYTSVVSEAVIQRSVAVLDTCLITWSLMQYR